MEADPRWDALELSCSLAAGRGGADFDLDVGLWHAEGARPDDAEVEAMLRGLGQVVGELTAWRIRVGDDRIIDDVLEGDVTVVRAGHRREVDDR